MINHVNVEHKGFRFLCKFCDTFTTSKDSLKKHIHRIHANETIDDDSIKGEFFFVDNKGDALSHDAKLMKVAEMEALLAEEMAKNEALMTAVDEPQAGASVLDTREAPPVREQSRKATCTATTSSVEQDWSIEEDRILLERLKNGMDHEIQLSNRTNQEVISRMNFLLDFVKKLKK